MTARSIILNVLYATALIAVACWLAVEHQTRLRLNEENAVLRQQLDQMAGLEAENGRLSDLVAQASGSQSLPDERWKELLRLRGEAGVLRQQSKELETLRNENRQVRAALENKLKTQHAGAPSGPATADYWPRDSWAFAGYASPDAALQTSFWAASKGDLKALLDGMTGEIQERVAKDLAGKSTDEATARAMDEVAKLKSINVLNREVQGDDTVVLTAAFEEGAGSHTSKLVMKKIGNDWKLSGPAQ